MVRWWRVQKGWMTERGVARERSSSFSIVSSLTLIASIAYSTWKRRPSGLKVLTPLSYSLRVRNMKLSCLFWLAKKIDERDESSDQSCCCLI